MYICKNVLYVTITVKENEAMNLRESKGGGHGKGSARAGNVDQYLRNS